MLPVVNMTCEDVPIKNGDVVGHIRQLEVQQRNVSKKEEFEGDKKIPISADMLNVNSGVPKGVIGKLVTLFNKYRECFALDLSELGCTNVMEMEIIDNNIPVRTKPFRASIAERETMTKIIDEWKEHGLVSDTKSPYASSCILVNKKDGDQRLVIDFRPLNGQTIKMNYPIPTIDEQFEGLHGKKLFTILDMGNAYLQIPLTEAAKEKTAFITQDTTGQCNRVIFGLCNAPYEFSRLMKIVLGPLGRDVVRWYLDDILIAAADWKDTLEKLELVLNALQTAHLTLKLKKCYFGQDTVEYLGYTLSADGLQPGTKIKAIEDYPIPRNIHELRRFLGLTSYFRRFVQDYARKSRHLTDLTRKEVPFVWGKQQQKSFDELKKALITAPVLRQFNTKASRTEVHTDASQAGLAGVLLQADNDEEVKPVYYISKKTTDAESRYASCKLELMAVAYALDKFRHYLIGMKFVVVTDCESVVHMNTQKTKNSQIARWFQLLQEFDFELKHRSGSKMAHVDALSRAPMADDEDALLNLQNRLEVLVIVTEEDKILMMQRSDGKLNEFIQILEKEADQRRAYEKHLVTDYVLKEGKLYRKVKHNSVAKLCYVIPDSMRKSICIEHHDLRGHFGVDRTVESIKARFWFRRMRRYVRHHISGCFKCLVSKVPAGKQPGELHPLPIPRRPFYRIHLDHCGPFVKSRRGNVHVLVIIDAFTRFVKLYPVKSTKTSVVLKRLKTFIQTYGIPNRIVTDRGTSFTSEHFQKYCADIGARHTLISPRHPQGNGMAERVMKTLVPTIMTTMEKEDEWDVKIGDVERYLNSGVNQSTGKAPYEALMGYNPEFGNNHWEDIVDQEVWHSPEEVQEDIRTRCAAKQEEAKRRYDTHRCKIEDFQIGDIVAMRWFTTATGQSTKLQPKYKSPFVVVEKLPSDTYRISSIPRKGRRQYVTTAHISQLKLYRNHEDDVDEDQIPETEEGSDDEENDEIPDDTETPEDENEKMNKTRVLTSESEPKGLVKELLNKRQRRIPVKFHDYVV